MKVELFVGLLYSEVHVLRLTESSRNNQRGVFFAYNIPGEKGFGTNSLKIERKIQ